MIYSWDEVGANESIVEAWFPTHVAGSYVVLGAEFELRYGGVAGAGEITAVRSVADDSGAHGLSFDLDDDQRQLLRAGMLDWGGPSRCSEQMAKAMGFASVQQLFRDVDVIRERILHSETMSESDWARALLATEICFASSLGSTIDWEIKTGFDDADTIRILRSLQVRLGPVVSKLRTGELF